MKDHILTVILHDNMTIDFKDGINQLNAHQAARQFIEVELLGFSLSEDETLHIAFEKSETLHLNPVLMNYDHEREKYILQIPKEVRDTAGEWNFTLYVKSNWNEETGAADNVYPSGKYTFYEHSAIPDDGTVIPTETDLIKIWNETKVNAETAKAKASEAVSAAGLSSASASSAYGSEQRAAKSETNASASASAAAGSESRAGSHAGLAIGAATAAAESAAQAEAARDEINPQLDQKADKTALNATNAALNQTNRNVEDLYTILDQAQTLTVTTLEDTYTTRETAGGENIVNGIQTAVKEIRGKTVAMENLIPYPYYNSTKTENGLTWTDNGDGTITVNGTPTGYTDFILSARLAIHGKFTLSGISAGTNLVYTVTFRKADGVAIVSITNAAITFNTADYNDYTYTEISIKRDNNIAINNVILRPMLNAGNEAKPYSKYFAGLKNAYFEKIVSTGKNLIPYPYAESTLTRNGVTFTVNRDGTITANGTATDNSEFNLSYNKKIVSSISFISGCPAGGSATTYCLRESTNQINDYGNGAVVNIFAQNQFWRIIIFSGTTVNNLVFKPMLNIGTAATAYEPYTSDTLAAENPIELAEWDIAYPETGETKRQSNTVTFNGTETWTYNSTAKDKPFVLDNIEIPAISNNSEVSIISNLYSGTNQSILPDKMLRFAYGTASTRLYIRDDIYTTIAEWKAYLVALAAAGNPLTVTYKTAESTTEAPPFDKSKYIAWKNGSETIEQGPMDNSEYGAENTVTQTYYTLTGGTTNEN